VGYEFAKVGCSPAFSVSSRYISRNFGKTLRNLILQPSPATMHPAIACILPGGFPVTDNRPPLSRSSKLILTTLEGVPGKTIIRHLGLVQGSTVRAKHLGRDIAAGFKNLVGGELKGYTELLQEARQEATQRMMQEAIKLGANAVVNVRFATSSLTQGAAELFVYGTAVQVD
jgi:uncharacterized protein YbjQ (UPF0145 family)